MATSSEDVGEILASALGDGPSRATLAAQRVLVIEMAQRSFRPRAQPQLWALVLAFVPLAAVAATLAFVLTRPRAFEARFRGVTVATEARLAATGMAPDALDFSDGSQVVLEPRARATLAALTPKRAGVRLNGGRMSASIRRHAGITWTVMAGPYTVHVVGTRFSVGWDANAGALEVFVREGRVRVTGGDLPAAGVHLDAGGRLERRDTKRALAPAVSEPSQVEGTASRTDQTGDGPVRAPAARDGDAISALAVKGKYKEALALAERQGFDRLTVELPENDLLLLANAARFSGDSVRARQALTRLRERFAGRPAADLATLYLAKIAEDRTHDSDEAVRWLRVFLRDSPQGDLTAGARASLMSLLLRAGDRVAARAVAKDYMRYHATGPHAEQARALVDE
jgi:hypothetical protein